MSTGTATTTTHHLQHYTERTFRRLCGGGSTRLLFCSPSSLSLTASEPTSASPSQRLQLSEKGLLDLRGRFFSCARGEKEGSRGDGRAAVEMEVRGGVGVVAGDEDGEVSGEEAGEEDGVGVGGGAGGEMGVDHSRWN